MIETLENRSRRVWVERDGSAIDEMRLPDARSHGLGNQTLVGVEDFRAFHRRLCELLATTELVVDHHIEADGWLAALCTFRGTSAGGKQVAISGAIHARIADGRIHEAYNSFDFLGLFTQLDLLPADSLQRCIAGEKIC